MRQIALMLPFTLIVMACAADQPPEADGPNVRDSAGITIVENERSTWEAGREWRLSDQPRLTIGVEQGEAPYELHRVTGSLRLPDGRIVIANAGTSEVRFYDASGTFLHASGRSGKGPGEFGTISSIHGFRGDSLLVWDTGNRRISVLDSDGVFSRSFSPGLFADQPVFVSLVAPLANGALLLGAFALRSGQSSLPVGPSRDTVVLVRCDYEGELIDTVGRFPGAEWYTTAEFPRMDLPFARDAFFVPQGTGFYLGDNARWEVSYRDLHGRVQRILRAAYPLVEVTPDDVEDQKQQWLADVGAGARQEVARMLEPVQGPPSMPAYSALRVDAAGNLWVQRHQRDTSLPMDWVVFDRDGAMLGTVTVPPRFVPHQIGLDFVLGKWRDDLGVEQVLLFALLKP